MYLNFAVIILAIILFVVVFVIMLQDGQRKIAVQYSQKIHGRKTVGGQSSHIPLKVNTAGVIPVIFASSIMSMPSYEEILDKMKEIKENILVLLILLKELMIKQ